MIFSQVIPHPTIWKISGNNLAKPSYIIGTFHLENQNILKEIPFYNDIYNSVDTVLFENITRNISTNFKNNGSSVVSKCLPKNIHYHELLDTMDRAILMKFYGKNYSLEYSPSILFAIFEGWEFNYLCKHIFHNRNRDSIKIKLTDLLDYGAMNQAIQDHKTILGLEDTTTINTVFNEMSLKQQSRYLAFRTKTWMQDISTSLCMDSIFLHSDFMKLSQYEHREWRRNEELIRYACGNDKTTCDSLVLKNKFYIQQQQINNRNSLWLPKLETYMKNNPCLIFVGLLHLYKTENSSGLLYLLRDRGYTITAM